MWVAIFYSRRQLNTPDYDGWAQRMQSQVQRHPGFSHSHSFRDESGFGVTLSYWSSKEALQAWGQQADHRDAQQYGRDHAYQEYRLEIAEIQAVRQFSRD